jgi:hypothetical protein
MEPGIGQVDPKGGGFGIKLPGVLEFRPAFVPLRSLSKHLGAHRVETDDFSFERGDRILILSGGTHLRVW